MKLQFTAGKTQAGFTILELVVTLAIFGLLVTGVLQSFSVSSTTTKAAREKVQLASLASQYLETVRNMPYSEVGTIVGNPNGPLPDLPNAVTAQLGAYSYKIYYEITYVDDPADGTILAGTDVAANDYKQVKMSVVNNATGEVTDFFTSVVPKGLEGLSNAGALLIKVFDAQGQPVSDADILITSVTGPAIILPRSSDSSGQWIEVGLPAGVNNYHIVVSKDNYSSDQTDPITVGNPNPTKPDPTIVNGVVTQVSFSIDLAANLAIKTQNNLCQDTNGVNLNVSGAKIIGTSPTVLKYSQNFSSSGGQVTMNNIEWDTYTPTLLTGQPWVVRGTSPVQKIDVLPGGSQTFTMILDTNSTPHSLLVIVKDAATTVALEGATVDLSISSGSPTPWYNLAWNYRKQLTIDHTKVSGSGTLTDFPVLVSTTDVDLKYTGNGGKVGKNTGIDILFTSANGVTKLDHELEYYDPVNGQIVAWVRMPSVPTNADTPFYIYFGNAAASDQQNKTGVWDSNFKGVWHLSEGDSTAAGFYKDSTANPNNGTLTDANGNSIAITGKIDGAVKFSGDADYINAGSAAKLDGFTQQTISFWVRRDVLSGSDFGLSGKSAWNILIRRNSGGSGPNTLRFTHNWSTQSGTWRGSTLINSTSNLYFVTITYNGGLTSNVPAIYVNGNPDTITAVQNPVGSLSSDAAGNFVFGTDASGGNYHNGILDEVRYSSVVRSADWVKTEYNNESSPATFYSYGSLEVPPAGPPGLIGSGVTGGSVWLQNDWAGGAGLANWSSASSNGYFTDDANIDVSTSPTGVRLRKSGGLYQMSGWLESATFDTGTSASNFSTLSWQPTSQDPATTLGFQLASSNSPSGPWNYVGPDGTGATYYTVPSTNISTSHDNHRYIRYRVYLTTTDNTKTSVLTSVTINYVSGCFTPGQVWFGNLNAGNYDLTVTLPGYTTKTISNINVNGNQSLEVPMSP